MARTTVIPFGPQHPVLPEPIHFELVTEDEKIVDAIPSISYVHRGLERLIEKRDFIDFVHVADRICGLCSFMHCMGYCQAVEEIMGIEVPERATVSAGHLGGAVAGPQPYLLARRGSRCLWL